MSLVISAAGRRQIVSELVAAAQFLASLTYHLYQNALNPSFSNVIGDFTEASFDGYAAIGPVVWGATFTDANGNANVVGQTLEYLMTGSATPNTIYGYYATQTVGSVVGALQYSEAFPTPVPMVLAFQATVITPVFKFGQ